MEFYANRFFTKTSQEYYIHFYTHILGVKFSCAKNDEIWLVDVSESADQSNDDRPPPDYWAFFDIHKNTFRFIYPSLVQLKMCSPDYFRCAIKEGEGRLVRVDVKPIKQIDRDEK